jgi:hypothetical protein
LSPYTCLSDTTNVRTEIPGFFALCGARSPETGLITSGRRLVTPFATKKSSISGSAVRLGGLVGV